MRQTILGFNQQKAIDLNLTLEDLLLLQYIMFANSEPTMDHIVDNGLAYVWLNHTKMTEDLPILKLSQGTLANKLCMLKSLGLIKSIVKTNDALRGSRAYYSMTSLAFDLLNTNEIAISNESTTSSENEVRHHSEMESNNILNNINNIVNIDKSIFTTTATADCSSVNDFLSNPKSSVKPATNITISENLPKKEKDPENSKSYKNVVGFITTLNYNEQTKEILMKWYTSVGVGKVSIKMLKDKITRLYESVKTEAEAYEAFNNAYINSWLAFYPPKKSSFKNYSRKENDSAYQEPIQTTEDMLAKNPDGTLMTFNL